MLFVFETLRNILIDVMHYGHSIKCRYYLDGIFIIQRVYKVLHTE